MTDLQRTSVEIRGYTSTSPKQKASDNSAGLSNLIGSCFWGLSETYSRHTARIKQDLEDGGGDRAVLDWKCTESRLKAES